VKKIITPSKTRTYLMFIYLSINLYGFQENPLKKTPLHKLALIEDIFSKYAHKKILISELAISGG